MRDRRGLNRPSLPRRCPPVAPADGYATSPTGEIAGTPAASPMRPGNSDAQTSEAAAWSGGEQTPDPRSSAWNYGVPGFVHTTENASGFGIFFDISTAFY